ncbi:ABC transporter ATP-binding protein [Rhodococcus sp. X156]|uniref:ABC transporter ATP-binding protein n=1 Tax=Rhodococcus sp. X156 TaxID=2499145 RepID=UPI001F498954|nr:ABC transporter ATP-binding protein [Rhodococcus sp. X156]
MSEISTAAPSGDRQPADQAAGAVFAASGVSVSFGGLVALNDVSFRVEPGQVHGVIGPNGAGKTTLFNVCCGFVAPDQGRLEWDGRELVKLRTHQLAGLGIARTLQGVGLFAGLTVLDNVTTGLAARRRAGFVSAALGLPRSDREERELRARAWSALERLGATGLAHRYPSTLPYPDQKRVALARAIVAEPRLLLLDEPAAGLSEEEMHELGETITALTSDMAVMLVEHHMDLVMRICDTLTVLDFGQVIAAGHPDQVRDDPAVVAAYLGAEVDPTDQLTIGRG